MNHGINNNNQNSTAMRKLNAVSENRNINESDAKTRTVYVLSFATAGYSCTAMYPELLKDRVLPVLKSIYKRNPRLIREILERIDEWSADVPKGRVYIGGGIVLGTDTHPSPERKNGCRWIIGRIA